MKQNLQIAAMLLVGILIAYALFLPREASSPGVDQAATVLPAIPTDCAALPPLRATADDSLARTGALILGKGGKQVVASLAHIQFDVRAAGQEDILQPDYPCHRDGYRLEAYPVAVDVAFH